MNKEASVEVVRTDGRWGVTVNGGLVATGLTARKAQRRATGIALGNMDNSGRCLTRKERGLPPVQKARVNLISAK